MRQKGCPIHSLEVQVYKEKTVASQLLENNIGYVSLSEFDVNTAEDFKKAVEEIKSTFDGVPVEVK